MTMCIAAACQVGDDEAIVLCTDWLVSGALGKAEQKLKVRMMSRSWNCLTAGEETDINAFVNILRSKFTDREVNGETLGQEVVLEVIRDSLAARKLEKIEELVLSQYGITYSDLRNFGKEKFPDDLHREVFERIRDLQIGTEWIVAGFDPTFATIITTERTGKAKIFEHFAVVGEGAYLAQTVLLSRNHRRLNSLGQALYTVYEAKKYAEGAPSVGEHTTMAVIYPDRDRAMITANGLAFLKKKYEEFGPKAVPKNLALPEDCIVVPPKPQTKS